MEGQEVSVFIFPEGGETGLLENFFVGYAFSKAIRAGKVNTIEQSRVHHGIKKKKPLQIYDMSLGKREIFLRNGASIDCKSHEDYRLTDQVRCIRHWLKREYLAMSCPTGKQKKL